MKTLVVVCTVVLLSTVLRTAALAQGADATAGTQETRKPARKAPSNSFEALPGILTVGEEVKVKDEEGGTTRGRVVSISDDQLIVARSRFLRPRAERTYAKDAVRSVDIVDSAEDGALIGAAVAVGLATALAAACSRSVSCKNGNFGGLGGFFTSSFAFVPVGIGLGYSIDAAVNETIYERPSQAPRVTVVPFLGRKAVGLLAHVQL